MTIGMAPLAARAASVPGVLRATMTLACSLTSSAASAGRRENSPSAERYSRT
jgi:hypothetical protein